MVGRRLDEYQFADAELSQRRQVLGLDTSRKFLTV
jgi:hypothetical protein